MPNPFGIEMGSTPGHDTADYFVTLSSVPKPHPDFKNYFAKWDPQNKLSRIHGNSEKFLNDRFGHQSKIIYEKIRSQLSSVYGNFDEIEYIEEYSAYSEDREFVESILIGDRTHMSTWSINTGSRLDSGISKIFLSIEADDSESSYVSLMYTFQNHDNNDQPSMSGSDSL